MARRSAQFNWVLILLGVAVLAGGVVVAIVVATTQTDMPIGRRQRVAGTIVGVAFIPAVILIAKGFGMK